MTYAEGLTHVAKMRCPCGDNRSCHCLALSSLDLVGRFPAKVKHSSMLRILHSMLRLNPMFTGGLCLISSPPSECTVFGSQRAEAAVSPKPGEGAYQALEQWFANVHCLHTKVLCQCDI